MTRGDAGQVQDSRSNRLRLLFVGAFPPSDRPIYGGMVTACRGLLGSSFSTRFDLDLLDSTQISNPPPRLPIRFALALWRLLKFALRLRRNPDVVLLFSASGLSLLEKGVMARYARMRGIPSVLFPRAGAVMEVYSSSRLQRGWIRWAMKGADSVLCQGEKWKQFVVEQLGRPANRTVVVPNWAATPELLSIGRSRRGTGGPPRLLFVGRVEKSKGVEELIAACTAISDRQFTLSIVGDGRYRKKAESVVGKGCLRDRVEFTGWRSGEQLRTMYANSDIFVLPSWNEGLPNALIEAMATGMAVVVTRVGAVENYVQNESNGILIPPRAPDALAAALTRLIDDVALRCRLSRSGFRTANRVFNLSTAVDLISLHLESVYRASHGGRTGPPDSRSSP